MCQWSIGQFVNGQWFSLLRSILLVMVIISHVGQLDVVLNDFDEGCLLVTSLGTKVLYKVF